MAIHVVNIGLFPIDATGAVIIKNSKSTTLQTMMVNTSSEHRIIPDSAISSTAGYPTVKAYLTLEEAAGYLLQHMDQTYIITRKA